MALKMVKAPRSWVRVEDCRHCRLARAGIQRFPVPPYRLYLLSCRSCGTTLSTWSLRIDRLAEADAPGVAGPGRPARWTAEGAYSSAPGIGQ